MSVNESASVLSEPVNKCPFVIVTKDFKMT